MLNNEISYQSANSIYHLVYFKFESVKNKMKHGEMHLFENINEVTEDGQKIPSIYISHHKFVCKNNKNSTFQLKFVNTSSSNPYYLDPYNGIEMVVNPNGNMVISHSSCELRIPKFYRASSYEQFLLEIQNVAKIIEELRGK
ncbi:MULTISPECIES: hypothetical protein [unclassified Paenibacillus]|uniref:hypothetical protein n=1 Tax=unclassified Paenibacillus TaxID=185978 RepID=UPI00363B4E42